MCEGDEARTLRAARVSVGGKDDLTFDPTVMQIDPERGSDRICGFIEKQVFSRYKRKGVVVGLSGGIDSALLACLCVRALGQDKVYGRILPKEDSSPGSAVCCRAGEGPG